MITNLNNYLFNMELRKPDILPSLDNNITLINERFNDEVTFSEILLSTTIYIVIRSVHIFFVLLYW